MGRSLLLLLWVSLVRVSKVYAKINIFVSAFLILIFYWKLTFINIYISKSQLSNVLCVFERILWLGTTNSLHISIKSSLLNYSSLCFLLEFVCFSPWLYISVTFYNSKSLCISVMSLLQKDALHISLVDCIFSNVRYLPPSSSLILCSWSLYLF